jgi:hypothetical protein
MPGPGTAWLETVVPSTVVSSAGNSGALTAPYSAQQIVVIPNVTAYTSGTVTFEVQWSFDGVNFYSVDQSSAGSATQVKDTFANLSATGSLFKVVPVRGPYYRVTWTTGAYTMNVQAGPAAPWATGAGDPESFVEGASSFIGQSPAAGGADYAPQFVFVPSTTLTAVYAAATASTYTGILAVPTIPSEVENVPVNRMSIKLNVSAETGTTPSFTFEVLWSFTGLPYNASTNPVPLFHGDPTDTFIPITSVAGAPVIKELVVKAPYFAIAATTVSGTTPSVTFTADIAPTCL